MNEKISQWKGLYVTELNGQVFASSDLDLVEAKLRGEPLGETAPKKPGGWIFLHRISKGKSSPVNEIQEKPFSIERYKELLEQLEVVLKELKTMT